MRHKPRRFEEEPCNLPQSLSKYLKAMSRSWRNFPARTRKAPRWKRRGNLREAVELVLEANRELAEQTLTGQSVTREPFLLASRTGGADLDWSKRDTRAISVGDAMKRVDLIRYLESQGCYLLRNRGKHSVYANPLNNQTSAVPPTVKSTIS